MPELIPDLPLLREVAEAAGPRAARALIALLTEYVETHDALQAVRTDAERALSRVQGVDAHVAAADRTIARYRAAGAALVARLRERQRRDPFRIDAALHGLRRAEDHAIREFHRVDQDMVDQALAQHAGRVQEVGHA